ncbi:polyprenyl synthetase family protein [Mucilaginibacter auburnensis]|uniref:Geranylgeranyl diphosphate synthase type II n=1 Tax=Mucilaginibacter auburnensis TaxID=1457233 RepID=A0A2H9VVH2_9SPHI|nr:polyprenyl synthetase family protein [Mucilaginibacter auburnensis]PJJ84820.1 geranylgeranyl diphosphate synthase type II [Mucilaginibacter auburnensis]
MRDINELQVIIQKAVEKIQFPAHPSKLYEPIAYILDMGGKRMRPALLLMACDLFDGDIEKAIPPALAIEVFHNFTLMHDDIMDNAPLRRGRATVHERWNSNTAILSGDVMLIEGYKLIMQVEDHLLRTILNIFNDTAVGVCEGQQLDMEFEDRADVSIPEYIEMIRLKTAVVLGGALKIGALVGGADMRDADLLLEFGENLGLAFQLQDDILDVYGDPKKFGKQVGGDILSNKKTYLLIKALELTEGAAKDDLNNWLSAAKFDSANKVAAVTEIYNTVDVRHHAESAMQFYAEKAFAALDSLGIAKDKKDYLRNFADSLMVREN